MELLKPFDEEKEVFNTDENNFQTDDLEKKIKFRKRLIPIAIFIILIVIIVIILIIIIKKGKMEDNKNGNKIYEKESTKIRLNNWEFVSSKEIDLNGKDISMGKSDYKFIQAPKDFYVCTAMGGLSGHENKFFYEKELENVEKSQFDDDWWFKTNFILKKSEKENNLVLLHINGINYKSDIYLDGNFVESQENIIGTFVKYTLDITSSLNNNELHFIAFKIKRPYNQWGGKDNYNQTDLAISFVDWNPEPPDSNMGIWQPVEIELVPKKILTISSVFVITKLIDDKKSNITIVIHTKNWENKNLTNNITIQIGDFVKFNLDNISLEANEEKQIIIDNNTCNDLVIDNSHLWWPYQMGEPKLHNLTIKVLNENKCYIYNKKVGLRQVDSELDENGKKRVFKINNKKLMLKGAGWTPDLFLRQSPENYWNHISYVRDMELNVIRLEGKSEGKEFYDYCDKLGILVISGWNCADAWERWKYWAKDVEELSNKSVISQIRKLSPHPSVIIFILGSDYAPSNGIEEKWRKIFEDEKWPNEILSSAAQYSGEGFTTGVKMSGPYSWVPPNYFYLSETKNNKYGGAYGFLTEGGPGENPLRKGSYEKIFNKENMYNYTSESWNYHCGNKGVFGDLNKIIIPINERYGNITNFDDFQRKSSAIVYESHRAMFEAYSWNKYESTGVIQWMLNNAWPSNIWHLYDYFFAPTSAYFATKKAGERIHVLYNYEDSFIYLLNNYFNDFENSFTLNSYIISGIDGKEIIENKSYTFNNIKGDAVLKVGQINNDIFTDLYILHLEYSYNYNGANNYYTNTYWLNKEMDMMNLTNPTFYNVKILKYADLSLLGNIANTNLSVTIQKKDIIKKENKFKNKYSLEIKNIGESIALLIEMKLYEKNNKSDEKEIISPIFWNDNYFSIRSGGFYNVIVEYYSKNQNDILLEIIGYNCEHYEILFESH